LYTNGVRVTVVRNPLRNWTLLDTFGRWWQAKGLFARAGLPTTSTSALIVGQHFFTPTVITDFAVDPLDRPYGAFTYTGFRLDVTEDASTSVLGIPLRQQHSFEAAVGVMGPLAAADEVQTGVHVLRKSRIPKGWSHQLDNEAAVGVSYSWRGRFGWDVRDWPNLDLTPHFGGYAGNVQTYGFAGLTARLGLNLSSFPALVLNPTAETRSQRRRAWEIAALAGVEGRAFAHNAFIDGSVLQQSPSVPGNAVVGDFRYGLTARIEEWRASLTMIRRSPETEQNGPFGNNYHNYGSINIAFEPGESSDTEWGEFYSETLPRLFGHLVAEAAIGGGRSRETAGATTSEPSNGMAMRVGLGLSFFDRVTVGWEMGGTVREGGAPANATDPHTDVFLTNNLFTARLQPFGTIRGKHDLYVRGGGGWALHKLQVVPRFAGTFEPGECPPTTELDTASNNRFCIREDTGHSWMLGGGYSYRLGDVGLGLDISRYMQSLDGPVDSADYFMTTFTVRYHPGA
jgi:hypothetical protein